MSGYGSWGCSLSQRILRMFPLTLAPKDVKPLEDVSYIILAPVSIFSLYAGRRFSMDVGLTSIPCTLQAKRPDCMMHSSVLIFR